MPPSCAQYGHRFRADSKIVDADDLPLRPPYRDFNHGRIQWRSPCSIILPPATMCAGDAIFSSCGRGRCAYPRCPSCRVVAMDLAQGLPGSEGYRGPSGKLEKTVGYEQEGIVWQAEEAEVGERWQRFYGFVGRYGLAKVPAEEIEFFPPDEEECIAVGEHLLVGCTPRLPLSKRSAVMRSEDPDYLPPMLFYHADQPIVFTVQALNRSGADQPSPTLVEDRGKKEGGRIPMLLQLRYCSENPVTDYWPGMSGIEPVYSLVGMPWTQIPRKMNEHFDREPD